MALKKSHRDIRLLVMLRRIGFSQNRIAHLLHMSTSTVHHYCSLILPGIRTIRNNPPPITEDIRRLLGLHDTQPGIHSACSPAGSKKNKNRTMPPHGITPAPHHDIYEMARSGAHVGDIAVALGISITECSKRMRQHIAWMRTHTAQSADTRHKSDKKR